MKGWRCETGLPVTHLLCRIPGRGLPKTARLCALKRYNAANTLLLGHARHLTRCLRVDMSSRGRPQSKLGPQERRGKLHVLRDAESTAQTRLPVISDIAQGY